MNEYIPTPLRMYHKASDKSRTLTRNEIDYHSDVVGALSVGAAPTE